MRPALDPDLEVGMALRGRLLALVLHQLGALGSLLVGSRRQRRVGVLPLLGGRVPPRQLELRLPVALTCDLRDQLLGAVSGSRAPA